MRNIGNHTRSFAFKTAQEPVIIP